MTFLLNALGRLWLMGVGVDWSGLHAREQCKRIAVPTYPFERQRYWLNAQRQPHTASARPIASGKKTDITDWFYVPVWKQLISTGSPANSVFSDRDANHLIFVDECGVGSQLAKRLEQKGQRVITVIEGEKFARIGSQAYAINPRRREDYETLLKDLYISGQFPERVTHLWSLTPDNQYRGYNDGEFDYQSQDSGFYSLLFFTQALTRQNVTASLQIEVISNNTQVVVGDEVICPEKATILGLCKVIPQEYPNITCDTIDITLPSPGTQQEEWLIDRLVAGVPTKRHELTTAYRGRHQWVQTFERVKLGSDKLSNPFREGGVYLMTGGLGAIGLTLAEYLAKTVQAKLVLVGHSTFPRKDEWEHWLATHNEQDMISRKIHTLQKLEDLNAEVLVVEADVANYTQMREMIAETYKRFGEIHGVIHAAGVTGEGAFRPIQETGRNELERQLRPKAYGLLVLERLLQGKKLDFCLVFSSLSSILGGLGFAAYAAANTFMDAFAQNPGRVGMTPLISVNWDAWQLKQEKGRNRSVGATLADLAITPAEGTEVFKRILSAIDVTQIVVSSGDLHARIDQWIKLESLQDKKPQAKEHHPSTLHPRPNLQSTYYAPTNELEKTIIAIWQRLLGIEQIGIHDNFFELGGHSLLATQLLSQLRTICWIDIPLRELFNAPTVAELARAINDAKSKGKNVGM